MPKPRKKLLFQRLKEKLSRKAILAMILIGLGVSLIPIGFFLSSEVEKLDENKLVRENFSTILLEVKDDLESEFSELLDEMSNDPLEGFIMDLMPTPEDIFLSEWSNDKFPDVLIPLIGSYIESIGTERVGDINLDNEPPEADLNISSIRNPSELSMQQCHALWDPFNLFSLTSGLPVIWFDLIDGNIENRSLLMTNFNLTESQIDTIIQWIINSQDGWMRTKIHSIIEFLNPIILFGLVGGGIALISVSSLLLRSELKKVKRN